MADTPPETGVDVGVEFSLQLGRLDDSVKAMHRRLNKPPAQPVFQRRPRTGAFATGSVLVLDHGHPPQGTFWYVRRWNVGGLDPSVAAAGVADLFVTASPFTALAAVGLADWVDEFPTLPNIEDYGRGVVPAQFGERVFTVIRGGTNAQAYVASIQIEAFEQGAVDESWGV